jgi:hypothetical protein
MNELSRAAGVDPRGPMGAPPGPLGLGIDRRRIKGVTMCDQGRLGRTAERWNLRFDPRLETLFRAPTGRTARDGARFGYRAGSVLAPSAYPRVTSDDALASDKPV